MEAMEAIGVNHFAVVVGVSYGGIVGYRIAAMYPSAVDRVVLISAGVCIEESNLPSGLFVVKDVMEAASLLLPQTLDKLRQLVRLTHYRPLGGVPSCFLADYIQGTRRQFTGRRRVCGVSMKRSASNLPLLSIDKA